MTDNEKQVYYLNPVCLAEIPKDRENVLCILSFRNISQTELDFGFMKYG